MKIPGERSSYGKAQRLCAVSAAVVLLGGVSACSKQKTKLDSKRAAAELSSGLKAQVAGAPSDAASHYNEALKYDPKNKYALYDLALLDAADSNYGEAENKYRAVLAIDPGYEPALFNLAILIKAKGDNAQALSLYERAVVAAPKDASAHLNLGLLLREMGQRALGDAEVKKAILLNPKLHDPAKTPAPTKSATATSSPSPTGS